MEQNFLNREIREISHSAPVLPSHTGFWFKEASPLHLTQGELLCIQTMYSAQSIQQVLLVWGNTFVVNYSGLHWYLKLSLYISIFTNWDHSIQHHWALASGLNLLLGTATQYMHFVWLRICMFLKCFLSQKSSVAESHPGSFWWGLWLRGIDWICCKNGAEGEQQSSKLLTGLSLRIEQKHQKTVSKLHISQCDMSC